MTARTKLRPLLAPGRRSGTRWTTVVVLTAAGSGFALALLTGPFVHSRFFPWIVGRGAGLAAYCSMWAMCLVGLWLRHPWRRRWPLLHPETSLRLHATLAAATLLLLATHVVALALDRYAGVGFIGVFVPGAASYRTVAVAVGVVACWLTVLVAATARVGARLVGRSWLPIHRLSLPLFVAVFCHGTLAGSDTLSLRAAYAVTGAAVFALYLTSRLARSETEAASGALAAPVPAAGRAPAAGHPPPPPGYRPTTPPAWPGSAR